jgi:hypothetical protein
VGLGDGPVSEPLADPPPVVPEAPLAILLPLVVAVPLLVGWRLRSARVTS